MVHPIGDFIDCKGINLSKAVAMRSEQMQLPKVFNIEKDTWTTHLVYNRVSESESKTNRNAF